MSKKEKFAFSIMGLGAVIGVTHYGIYGFEPLEWNARLAVLGMYLFGFGSGLWSSGLNGWSSKNLDKA